jgi:hypothetical protein
MVAFFSTLLRLFFHVFRSRRTILSEIALVKKENEILLRKMGKKKVHFGFYDRLFLVVLNKASDIKRQLTLVKPETILCWQRILLKRSWALEHRPAPRGRKPVDAEVKDLTLSMTNDNLLWAVDAPNTNSIMERFFRTVRREALDKCLLTGKNQIERILDEYVAFYNSQRPHQGIQQQIPRPGESERTDGAVRKSAVLGGLHHHYFRQAA